MAQLILTIDTRSSPLGFTPLDIEIAGGLIDAFYLVCLGREYPSIGPENYEAVIEAVSYTNPYRVVTLFKNISVRSAIAVLDRTIFYKESKEARFIANEKSRQELVSMKIENACKLAQAKKKLLAAGLAEEEAAKLMREIASDQRAILKIQGPKG